MKIAIIQDVPFFYGNIKFQDLFTWVKYQYSVASVTSNFRFSSWVIPANMQ